MISSPAMGASRAPVVIQQGELISAPRPSGNQSLLFPYLQNSGGFDTEITISDTSSDSLGSTQQPSSCTLAFYGANAPSSQNTAVPPAGQQLVINVSAIAPGFSGYIIANCTSPLTRGFAKVFQPGVTAISYDAQLLTTPRSTVNSNFLFPYLTTFTGFGSAIAIANTSNDPFGTAPNSGSCTLTFYGISAPAPFTTPTIAAGTVYTTTVAGSGFAGYAFAQCNFYGAAAFAFAEGQPTSGVIPSYSEAPESVTLPRGNNNSPLLFSFASNQNSQDSGIAILNTTSDPFGANGATPTGGTCTLNFYGANAPAAFTTPSIPAGGVYANTVSSLAPNFQGYVTATCQFPQARGFEYITNSNTVDADSILPEPLTTPRNTAATSLLFSAVSNWNGNDTNITISNTTEDSFGTTQSSGTCTISYFGQNAPSAQVSTSIAAGGQLSFSLSAGNMAQGIASAPGFRGYIVATCSFPLARGVAIISGNPPGATPAPGSVAIASIDEIDSATGTLAPGAQAFVSGTNLAPFITTLVTALPVGTSVDGITVAVDGRLAPEFAVLGGDLGFQIPYETAAGTAEVVVSNNGVASAQFPIQVQAAEPSIFAEPGGSGANVWNQNNTMNASGNPASVESTITAYFTGAGVVNPPVADGTAPTGLSTAVASYSATIGGIPAAVTFLGAAPAGTGIDQANIVVPGALASGSYPLVITVNGVASNAATVYVSAAAPGSLTVTNNGNLGTFPIGTLPVFPGLALNATGGSGNYTWSFVSGMMPPGVNIANLPGSNPAQPGLVGVATTPGTYAFTLAVNDGQHPPVDQAFTMKISGLTLKDINVPDAFSNQPYNQGKGYQLTALECSATTGCAAAAGVTFTVTSPALPAWLTLSSTGLLSGTPPANFVGSVQINFSINDGVDTVFRGMTLWVWAVSLSSNQGLSPVDGSLPVATQGVAYSVTLQGSSPNGGYTYQITGCCGLPPGLNLNQSTGLISGTTNGGPGVYGFDVTVTDNLNYSFQKAMAIDVVGSTPSQAEITPPLADDVVVGDTYGTQIPTCCGGKQPFTWTVSGLPTGLSIRWGGGVTSDYINPGGAEIWGVASVPGTYNVTVTATDALGATSTLSFPLHVAVLDLIPHNLPNGTFNTPSSTTFQIIGGTPPYSFAQLEGQYNGLLPAGLTVNATQAANGYFTVSGTPQEAGGFDPVWKITDSAQNPPNNTPNTLLRNNYFNINSVGNQINIGNPGDLGSDTAGSNYSVQLNACCDATGTFGWSIVGMQPSGISLNASTGVLSVAPSTPANVYTFLVEATDPSRVASPGFRQFTLNVTPISIQTNSLPYGNMGTVYPNANAPGVQLIANGGTGTLTWSLNLGSFLPPGLSLSPTGLISGTPTGTGQYSFAIKVTDQNNNSAVAYYNVNIYGLGQYPPPTFNFGTNLGTWSLGTRFFALGASGGNGTYTWSLVPVAGQSLPNGIALRSDVPSFFAQNQQAGLIGVATAPGAYTFTLSVTSAGQTNTATFTVNVSALDLQDPNLPTAFVNQPFSHQFMPIGYAGLLSSVNFSFISNNSTNNALPPGLTLSNSGLLSGMPTTAGSYTIAMFINDGVSEQYEQYQLTVSAISISTPNALPNGPPGALINGTQNSAYSATITASGGTPGPGGYTFTANCCLPGGLTLSSAGVISGTINAGPGLYGFNVTATDSNNVSYSMLMSIDVIGSPIALPRITTNTINDSVVGDSYGAIIGICCGGAAPFTWSAINLPPGMFTQAVSSYNNVVPGQFQLTGKPEQAAANQTYNAEFTVTDANGVQVTATIPIHVSVLDISGGLPNGMIDVPYSATFHVIGGPAQVVSASQTGYSATGPIDGELPYDLMLNGLTVSGTPWENGFNFDAPEFTFSDSNGDTLSRQMGIGISAGNSTITINGNGFEGFYLGTAAVNAPYSTQFSACCDNSNSFNWKLDPQSPALPTGLSLSASGQLSGTPTAANPPGPYTILIDAVDPNPNNPANIGVKSFVLVVSPLSITSAPPPFGNVGQPYSATLTTSGNNGAVTWKQIFPQGSQLPYGLTLNASGTITGTPITAGAYIVNLQAKDAAGNIAVASYTINIYPSASPQGLTNTANGGASNPANFTNPTNLYPGGLPPVTFQFGPNLGTWTLGSRWFGLGANGGNGTYTWSLVPVQGQSLPPGVALRTDVPSFFSPSQQAGLIGVATAPGTYTFTLSVNSGGQMAMGTFTVLVSALDLQDPNIPDAFVGQAFSHQFTPINYAGSAGSVTFAVNSNSTNGVLPPGLMLDPSGLLHGMPTTAGVYTVAMNIHDPVSGVTQYEQFSLNVFAISISTPNGLPNGPPGALVNGTQFSAYSATLTASGGAPGGYTFSVNCCLPNGLTLSAAGVISGTITGGPGLYGFTVTAADSNHVSYSELMSIDVIGSPIALPRITTDIVNDPVVGNRYGAIIGVCCGGTAPFTWSASNLPPGMFTQAVSTYDNVVPGQFQLTGIPQPAAANQTYNVEFTVTDANGVQVTGTIPIHVSVLDLNLPGTFSAFGLPNGTIGVPYSSTFRVLGGPTTPAGAPEVYTAARAADGELPDGLSFSGLTVSGTPLENGFNFNGPAFVFTDANGDTLYRQMGIGISGGTSAVSIGANGFYGFNLGTTPVNTSYSTTFQACCDASNTFRFSVDANSPTLPPGLSLLSYGVLSGTPATPGAYTFIIDATDPSNAANVGVKSFTLVVTPLSITNNPPPFGNVGVAYNAPLTVSGNNGTVVWTQIFPQGSQLPPGLTLNSNGTITGTPATAGAYIVTFQAEDNNGTNGHIAIVSYTINIYPNATGLTNTANGGAANPANFTNPTNLYPGGQPPLVLNFGPNLGNFPIGPLYFSLPASGGTPPYTFSLTPGANVVPGMRVQNGQPLPTFFANTVTGGFLGVVTTAGPQSASIRVTDAAGTTFDRTINFNVLPVSVLNVSPPPNATAGTPYSFTFTPYGSGSGNYIWSLAGNPSWLTINQQGQISGTPPAAGTYNFSVGIADAASPQSVAYFGYNITVNPFAITDPFELPAATAGVMYSYTFHAPGCGSPCTWSVYQGNVPPSGLTLNGPVLSGTPTSANGVYGDFIIQASGPNGAVQKRFLATVIPTNVVDLSINTTINQTMVVGGNVSTGLSASGGVPPYSWSIVPQAGQMLPPGVTLQGPGETIAPYLFTGQQYLAGRAMAVGTYNFTVKVSDSAMPMPNTATQTLSMTISPMSIQYGSLPNPGNPLIYNTAYTQPMLVIGGTGNYASWTTAGPIYPGLSLTCLTAQQTVASCSPASPATATPSTGVVTGIPTNTGSVSSIWTVTDSGGNSAIQSVSINAVSSATVEITLGGPGTGTILDSGTFSSYNLNPSGGTPPYIVSAVGSLPAGVLLNGSTLEIFPESSGTLTFTIQAVDANGLTGARTYTVIATDFSPAITGSLPNGSVGVPYSAAPYSASSNSPTWALPSTSALPPGLSLVNGVISGTPTAPGNYSFNLTLTDASGTATQGFSIAISNITITGPATLPNATVGVAYSVPITALGAASVTWTANSLPNGLSISSSGVISGTPGSGSAGTYTVTIQVSPVGGGVSYSQTFTLFVTNPNPTELQVGLGATQLSDAVVGQDYYTTLNPNGGVPPYTWSVAPGSSLPGWLHLLTGNALPSIAAPDTTALGGLPPAPGQITFSLIATDSTGAAVTRAFSLNVTPIFVSTNFPTIVENTPFSYQFVPVGGTGPYTFSIASTSLTEPMLPPGLNLNTTTGVISGTATSTGNYQFTLTVQDSAGHSLKRIFNPLATSSSGLYIQTSNLIEPTGGFFFQTLNVCCNPSASYSWSVPPGSLPQGVTLGSGNGTVDTLSGNIQIPPGTYNFTVTATDKSSGNTADYAFTLEVSTMQFVVPAQVGIAPPPLPPGQVGTPYGGQNGFQLQVAGGTPPYTFSLSNASVAAALGISLSPTGVLSGTPAISGAFNAVIVVTDAAGASNSLTLQSLLVIAPQGKATPLEANSSFLGFNSASVGVPYEQPLDRAVYGGTPPYTWTWAAAPGSSLPPGLSIVPGANGVGNYIAGVPALGSAGSYSVIGTVTDSAGQSLTLPATISVSFIAITPNTIPPGVAGTPYSVTFTASGGTAPYNFDAADIVGVPPGLTLNTTSPTTAVLSGTPSSPGNFIFGVNVQDANSNSQFQVYEVTFDDASDEAPAVSISPNTINVSYMIGAASPSAPLTVASTSGNLQFNAAFNGIPGASLSATNGTTQNGDITLNFSGAPLTTPGVYSGLVAVSAPGAVNMQYAAPVVLTVSAPCQITLSPPNVSLPASGGTGSFDVAGGASCPWSAMPSDPSITITSATSGMGNGTITYTVNPNNSAFAVTKSIAVANQTYTINQFAAVGCSFGISPSTIGSTSAAGNAYVSVTASAPSCAWSSSGGLTVSPSSGTGSMQVMVAIPANTSTNPQVLMETIAGQTLTVNQAAVTCTVTLGSADASIAASGGGGSVTVTTQAGCPYSTTNIPTWVSVISGSTGTGSGTLTFTVLPSSTTASQTATLLIGEQPFSITQMGQTCSVTLDPSGLGSPFASGSVAGGTINVNTNVAGCSWIARTSSPWVTVSPTSGTGNGTVTVTPNQPNSSANALTGSVSIGGTTVNFSQAGTTCTYTLGSLTGNAPYSGGNGSVRVITAPGCMWTAVSNNAPSLSITSSGTQGTADIDFTVQANANAGQQTYSLTITPMTGNAQPLTYTMTEAGAPCTLSPTAPTTLNINVAQGGIAAASPATLTLSTMQAGCAAPAPMSYANWLHITNAGSFDGTNLTNVTYYVDANPASMNRTGTIQIANELFTVNQAAAACAFSLNTYGAAFGQAGGPGVVLASESALGCSLSPSTNQPSIVTQITQSPPAAGGDVFTENYTISVFNSLVNAIRKAQIVIGGQIFMIKQTSW